MRLTIELERNPMPAGEPTSITTTVANVGDDDLMWLRDGCARALYVSGVMDAAKWRPGVENQVGAALEYRKVALEGIDAEGGAIWIGFEQEAFLGHRGSYGCADVGIIDRLAPGDEIVRRDVWLGYAGQLLGPPPTGRVPLTGSFPRYWREQDGEPGDITKQHLDVPLDGWIVQAGQASVDPAEAIDAALTDERLVEMIEARDLRNGNEPLVRFDPGEGMWRVGLIDYTEPPTVHLVLVDGVSGTVSGWEKRIWNYDTDGFP